MNGSKMRHHSLLGAKSLTFTPYSYTEVKAMPKKVKLNNDFGSKAMKEMEENNESDHDSEPMDDEDEEEYDEEDEDDEDIENLPRMFYEFALSQLEIGDKAAVQKALVSSEKAKTLIIETNEDLKSLLTKALKRKAGDNKVPPGSGLVNRSISDNRFFLSLINILQARAHLTENNVQNALKSLREALIWFPRSIEANYLCGEILRGYAVNRDQLSDAENYYTKAVETLNTLQKTIDASNATKQPQSALQQRLAANLSNNSSTATSNSATNASKSAANVEEEESNIDEEEYNQNLVDTELCCGDKATQALILYYCQTEGCDNKAYKYLAAKGYKLKLSNQVLQYPITTTSDSSISTTTTSNTTVFKATSTTTAASAAEDSSTYLSVIDNAMEKSVLSHLSRVFRPESPFWSEHHYDTTSNASKTVGYFSYLYPMRERAAKSSIEQIIDKIYPLVCAQFPQAAEANIAEWWVHSRPHINGHQLHFDSDETRIESGRRPAHPIVSCVLFVEVDVGGPTLVTNQKITGDLATKGWIAMPETNRLVTFDASYLHGVIPGRGTNPSLLDTSKNPRRLTFMVGFWREICAKPRGVDSPGPGQPLPDLALTKYTWPLEMTLQDTLKSKGGGSGNAEQLQLQKVVPIELTSIWEPIESRVDHEVVTKHSSDKDGMEGKPSSGGKNSSNEKISYNTCFQGF